MARTQPSPITGLSWCCDDKGVRCYYTGSLNAFHSFVYWDRERGESVAFVSNSSMPPWQAISLQRELVAVLAGRPVRTEATPTFESFDKRTRAAMAGEYYAEGLGTVKVSSDAEGLRLQIGTGLEFDAFQVSREVFYVPGPNYWLAFSGGPRPEAMHIRSMFIDTVAHRAAADKASRGN